VISALLGPRVGRQIDLIGGRPVLTISKLTLAAGLVLLGLAHSIPLSIFGPQNYAYRLGLIGAPARLAQATAPLAFGLLIDVMGSRILIVSSALSLAALAALSLLKYRAQQC
jgi:hypothetical protein